MDLWLIVLCEIVLFLLIFLLYIQLKV